MRYRWILLDADGTLFDYDGAERAALSQALAEVDLELTPEVRGHHKQISKVLWGRFEQGTITAARLRTQRFEELFEVLGAEADPSVVSDRYVELLGEQGQLLPGAEEIVEVLVQGAQLVLATNGLAGVQRSRLARSTLRDRFQELVISDEVGHPKPDPAFFDEAFRRMGDPPRDEILMVGDSLSSDIAGGEAAGIDTCWFVPDPTVPDPTAPRPTYRISRLEQLERVARFGMDAEAEES